jgi:hypothetical protein
VFPIIALNIIFANSTLVNEQVMMAITRKDDFVSEPKTSDVIAREWNR